MSFDWLSYVFPHAEQQEALRNELAQRSTAGRKLIESACQTAGIAKVLTQAFLYDPFNGELPRSVLLTALEEAFDTLGHERPASGDREALLVCSDRDTRIEHARLFITPPPLVSMYGRAYVSGPQHAAGERNLVSRFYEKSGLTVNKSHHEPADHLVCELEFLQYLAFYEALAWAANDPAEAREWDHLTKEFLAQHALCFMQTFADRVKSETRDPFYVTSASLLEAYLENAEAAHRDIPETPATLRTR